MKRLTLARLLGAIMIGVALLVGLLGQQVLEISEETILRVSEQRRSATAQRIGERVRRELDEAADAVLDVERVLISGAHDSDLEPALYAGLINRPRLAELSLTFSEQENPAKLALERGPSGEIATRRVFAGDEGFTFERRERARGARFDDVALKETGRAPDPRAHATYSTTASIGGRLIWSDLSYAEADSALPPAERRIVVSAQKLVVDRDGRSIGVVRAALDIGAVDEIARSAVGTSDPHRIFISDDQGRLITRLEASQRIVETGGALRLDSADVPAPIARALRSGLMAEASETGDAAGEMLVDEERWLATFHALPASQDWFVGIVVPASVYTRELDPLKARLALFSGGVLLIVLLGGVLALVPIQKNLSRIVSLTERMLRFDFTADPSTSRLADVREVLGSLERAKTALRALGKYVPIDLVRELYRDNKEPMLGGELRTLSIMFTDIKDFTTVSERMSPDALADALGLYLEAMTRAIRGTGGTIDKFIGDAVMALWNAPSPAPGHAILSCRAALACVQATEQLYARPDWGDRPHFYTRFGIHQDRVMVGNFGAPERLAYTALGDGVNLAARLEGLCKQYGVQILVSEAIASEARSHFAFRAIDRVAVKGRAGGVAVFELLKDGVPERLQLARRYEEALAAYLSQDFARAVALLEAQTDDPPSSVLIERCRLYCAHPPPRSWDGVFVAMSK